MGIRVATAGEAVGLSELLRQAGCAIAPSALGERLDGIHRGAGTALAAMAWDPPSGLVVLHWYRTIEAARPVARITSLLVAPDERRRGIGRLLVKAASQAARTAGCGTLELCATPEQPDLQAFCRAAGFTGAGCFTRPLRKKG